MDGLTIKHDADLERAYGKWVLVRRSLGIGSFGINAVELPPGEAIPEHDESGRAHEEVFLVLDGDAVPLFHGSYDPPIFDIVAAPVSTYGVVVFLKYDFDQSRVFVYKHTGGA